MSEAFGETGNLRRVGAIRPGNLSTQTWGRKHLPGVAELVGVERDSNELHRLQILGTEHLRHVARLVGADAVLASQRSPNVETIGQDFRGNLFGQFGLTVNRVVVTDERVQVAVAGVEHVANRQAGLDFELTDPPEHLRQLAARDLGLAVRLLEGRL